MGPSWGISWKRFSCWMWSTVSRDGLRPAWGQKTWFSIAALSGSVSKSDVNSFQTFASPYLRRHSS